MDTNKIGFLNILREYFSTLKNEDILVGDRRNIKIPIEWIFTEKIDRTIIEQAMASFLKQANPDYVSKAHHIGFFPDKIKELSLRTGYNNTNLAVLGKDDWTKAIISSSPNPNSRLKIVTEDDFYKEILNVLNRNTLSEIQNSLGLNQEQLNHISSIFATSGSEVLTLDGIKTAMQNAAKNLTEYYQYLIEEKSKSSVNEITIVQRTDLGMSKSSPVNQTRPRVNPIYPLSERTKIFEEMNPNDTIQINEVDIDGNIIPASYICYKFDNPRNKDGILLAYEPLEGNISSRIVYINQETYDSFEVDGDSNKTDELVRKYIEMSNNEFLSQPNTIVPRHTELESYKDRLTRIILGEESKRTRREKKYYIDLDTKLFLPSGIRDAVASKSIGLSEIKGARTLLEEKSTDKDKDPKVPGNSN